MSTDKSTSASRTVENASSLNKSVHQLSPKNESAVPPDPQVKAKKQYAQRRFFDVAYKKRMLASYDACSDATERGILLRKEGIYYSSIKSWRDQMNQKIKGRKNTIRLDHLARENEQLKKKLSQAEAIIDLQKKVSDLLGTHILPLENSEVNS